MLVLSRKIRERVWIGDDVCVTVVRIGRDQVRLGFEAPRSRQIVREELIGTAVACEDSGSGLNEETAEGGHPTACVDGAHAALEYPS